MWMKHQSKYENIVYVALWGMLFAAPLLTMYVRMKSGDLAAFHWDEVLHVWQQFAGFLLLFLFHNFVLAPLLVYRQRNGLYIGSVVVMVVLFAIFQCATQPEELRHRHNGMKGGPRHRHEMMEHHEPSHFNKDFEGNYSEDFEGNHNENFEGNHHEDFEGGFNDDFRKSRQQPPTPRDLDHKGGRGPIMVGWHDVFSIIMLILMLGMNLGIKFYFKSRGDQQKLIALEKENLEQQLEYLKYQINPHFFMNTLNNIHALVDIDPEKAKDTILELSKMMRFVLYEGDKQGVPLTREFDFIRNYITLMKLRYTDKVKINVDLPKEAPDTTIPPLMLISFVENAFKHGISYQHESFIDVKVGIEHERLRFQCRNSKADKPNQEKGGVGLQNVKQRLNLLYDNNFTLNIQDEPDIYNVELIIPLNGKS